MGQYIMTHAERCKILGKTLSHVQSKKLFAKTLEKPINEEWAKHLCVDCERYKGERQDECDDLAGCPVQCWRPKGVILVWDEEPA